MSSSLTVLGWGSGRTVEVIVEVVAWLVGSMASPVVVESVDDGELEPAAALASVAVLELLEAVKAVGGPAMGEGDGELSGELEPELSLFVLVRRI